MTGKYAVWAAWLILKVLNDVATVKTLPEFLYHLPSFLLRWQYFDWIEKLHASIFAELKITL